ncbi:MAG: thioredoxin family protein [Bacteroidota bacterium]
MKTFAYLVMIVLTALCSTPAQQTKSKPDSGAGKSHSQFDPSRDADKDIRTGIKEAGLSGKKVLLDVGGQWCIWCRRLDKFFEDNADANKLLHDNYVVVKVNYSPENKNEKVLSRYPKVAGYPHIFVLDSKGTLIHSQNTGELESGKGYDKAKILAFLEKYK